MNRHFRVFWPSGWNRAVAVCAVAFVALAFGCGSQPVPLRAQAGTTFLLAIPATMEAYGTAGQAHFGAAALDPADVSTGLPTSSVAPYNADPTLEDIQRGELAIKISNATDAFWVPVSYVTRVQTDPASPAGVDSRWFTTSLNNLRTYQTGQTLALINIPSTVPEGLYYLTVTVMARDATTQDFVPSHQIGQWGSPGDDELYILAADQVGVDHFTPLNALVANGKVPLAESITHLKSLVPDPVGIFRYFRYEQTGCGAFDLPKTPAAAEVTIDFPKNSIEIVSVVPVGAAGSGSLLKHRIETLSGQPSGCGEMSRLHVYHVDPDELVELFGVVFRPIEGLGGTCTGGVVDPSDFVISSVTGYLLDGSEIVNLDLKPPVIY